MESNVTQLKPVSIALDDKLIPKRIECSEIRQNAQPRSLVISEVFPPQHGGSGKWLLEIYRRQPAFQYLMAVGNSHGTDPIDDHYPQLIQRIDLGMRNRSPRSVASLSCYLKQIRMLRRMVSQNSIRMVHAARPLSEGLIARCLYALTGVPYVCFVHGEDVNVALTSRELRLLTSSVLAHSRCVIATSTFTKQLLIDDWKIKEAKIAMINPGVDTAFFAPTAQEAQRPKRWQGKFVLLTVGRLQQRKGQDMVLRALALLRATFPDLYYVIAGHGDDLERLTQLASDLGVADIVEFVGAIDDESLRTLYRNCDLFVLANRSVGKDVEGFGMVLLEAQACGKPVIAGMSGGTSDTMLVDESGFIVDCTSPDNLVDYIRMLIRDPVKRERMGDIARKHTIDNFEWTLQASRAESLFAQL